MNKIGFSFSTDENKDVITNTYEPESDIPVRSVATVRFEDGREYPYYNDKFNLKIGDKVYVDGKLYGKLGVVIDVTTKFKINRSIYKDVIAKLDFNISGNFKKCNDFMLAKGNNIITKEQLLTWFVPPFVPKDENDKPDEYLYGEGYSCEIGNVNCDRQSLDDAIEILEDSELKVILVNDGVGTAVVKTQHTHIVEFKIDNNILSDIYCDCVSPNFCKHIASVCVLLSVFFKDKVVGTGDSFFAVNHEWFAKIIEDKDIQI